jgi:hypothetical protein
MKKEEQKHIGSGTIHAKVRELKTFTTGEEHISQGEHKWKGAISHLIY